MQKLSALAKAHTREHAPFSFAMKQIPCQDPIFSARLCLQWQRENVSPGTRVLKFNEVFLVQPYNRVKVEAAFTISTSAHFRFHETRKRNELHFRMEIIKRDKSLPKNSENDCKKKIARNIVKSCILSLAPSFSFFLSSYPTLLRGPALVRNSPLLPSKQDTITLEGSAES